MHPKQLMAVKVSIVWLLQLALQFLMQLSLKQELH